MSVDQSSSAESASVGGQLKVLSPIAVVPPPGLMARSLENVIPGRGKFIVFLWFAAVAGLLLLFASIQGKATQFHGIAESQQQAISFQYPVEIVEVSVVEGAQVSKDTRILKVRRYDLDLNLASIDEKIAEIKQAQSAAQRSSNAEIASLQAERFSLIEKINTRVESLQTRYRLNRAQARSISAESVEDQDDLDSPLLTELKGLKAEKAGISSLFQARINSLEKGLLENLAPDQNRIAELKIRRKEMLRQSLALDVKAPFSGSVGSLMYKPGEQVAAFNTVISMHRTTTRQIKGFIHEAVINDVQLGQVVWIKSTGTEGQPQLVGGIVESLGSRIVEYPDRLKRSPLVSAWGREAIIHIQPNNGLLLGEKVTVLLNRPQLLWRRVAELIGNYLPISNLYAWMEKDETSAQQIPWIIDISVDGLAAAQIEASGIVWNPSSQSYLLVSDEHSAIFEMNRSGKIIRRHALDGSASVNDLESISRDGKYVYAAASLSHNRQQKLKQKRRQLLRFEFDQNKLQGMQSIDLYALLETLQQKDSESELGLFLAQAIAQQTIDIEAHVVVANTLYLGFKRPVDSEGKAVLLKIENVDLLFAGGPVQASIWQRIKLQDESQVTAGLLSDFAITESALYLLSIGKQDGVDTSYLWRFDRATQRLQKLAVYSEIKAEGLSVDEKNLTAVIVFDGAGKSPSQVHRLRI